MYPMWALRVTIARSLIFKRVTTNVLAIQYFIRTAACKEIPLSVLNSEKS